MVPSIYISQASGFGWAYKCAFNGWNNTISNGWKIWIVCVPGSTCGYFFFCISWIIWIVGAMTIEYQVVISIFLYAMVLQSHSHTQCIGNPTFRVDSPTKPLLATFSPTNHWSYSTVRLSIRWSGPARCQAYFM